MFAYLFSGEREKKGMELVGWGDGENLGVVGGEKTMIRIYCIGVFIFFSKKRKRMVKGLWRITHLILILEVVAFLFICSFGWLLAF